MQVSLNNHKWLILPFENIVREFYGKLLLSAVAAERDWGVIMAYKGDIRHNLPDMHGVVIEMNMTNSERVNRYLSHGWRVCAWDEEGLIYNDRDEYAHRRLNEEAIKEHDLIFLWGENQRKDVLHYIHGIENKLILTGNPRFDMLRPDLREFYSPDAASLKRKFGRYILLVTTFGDVNHYFGKDYTLHILRDAGKINTKEQELDQIAREEHQVLKMRAFIDMVPVVSAHFPDHKIIIRPHPSENFDTWRSVAQDLPNAMMIHEGDPVPWMLGAEAVIHNSCTTGVQAYLLGRPVIAYMPVRSDKYDQYLPNAVSYRAEDIDQLITLIKELTSNTSPIDLMMDHEKWPVIQEYIESLEGPWASDRIMDALEKLDIPAQALEFSFFSATKENCGQPKTSINILTKLKEWVRHHLMGEHPDPSAPLAKNWENYQRQRFPTISFNTIQSDLKKLQEITGRFSNVQISLIGSHNHIVCVYPAEK
jgi:surface carbohydrate biosynthesis protein